MSDEVVLLDGLGHPQGIAVDDLHKKLCAVSGGLGNWAFRALPAPYTPWLLNIAMENPL